MNRNNLFVPFDQTLDVLNQGGDRLPPTLGHESELQEEEDGSDSDVEGAVRGRARYHDDDADDGGSDASEGEDAQWAAVDAFALRKPQGKGGGGRFSRIEEEVS